MNPIVPLSILNTRAMRTEISARIMIYKLSNAIKCQSSINLSLHRCIGLPPAPNGTDGIETAPGSMPYCAIKSSGEMSGSTVFISGSRGTTGSLTVERCSLIVPDRVTAADFGLLRRIVGEFGEPGGGLVRADRGRTKQSVLPYSTPSVPTTSRTGEVVRLPGDLVREQLMHLIGYMKPANKSSSPSSPVLGAVCMFFSIICKALHRL